MMSKTLSRRNLLKLGTAGIVGALLPGRSAFGLTDQASFAASRRNNEDEPKGYGLALAGGTLVRAEPSINAKKVRALKRDDVVGIFDQMETKSGSAYNKLWYQVDDGYVHSANLLEVPNSSGNVALPEAGEHGFWVELSVPYFDVRSGPGMSAGRSKYRYYGGTVYKVKDVVKADSVPDESKLLFGAIDETWYMLDDEQFPGRYFVPASYMRVITEDEIAPISEDVAARDKTITVNLKEQRVYCYEKDKEVFTARCASGRNYNGGNFQTPKGEHFSYRKTPSQHMWGGAVGDDGSFDLPGIPWVTYFVTTGVAFHGTYWHNDYGQPRSHGCVNLTAANSKWIFRWTRPVHDPAPKNWYTSVAWRKPNPEEITVVRVV